MTMFAPITGATSAAASTGTSSMLGSLGGDAFLKLMVAQLRFQNPMSPSDPSAMLQQTAQFTQVETMQKLAASQQQLLGLSQALMASGMVGQDITASWPDGTVVSGTVDKVRFTADGPLLTLGGTEVPMTLITEVGAAENPSPTAAGSATDTTV